MIEYFYDAIRAVAGQEIIISASITDEWDEVITEDCSLMLHDADKTMIGAVEGVFNPDINEWLFTIPYDMTIGCKGRYWYCIQHEGNNLCFLNPIYLV